MRKRRRQTLPALLLRPVDAVLGRLRRRSSARPQSLAARLLAPILVGFMGDERVSEDDLRKFFAAAFALCAIVVALSVGPPARAQIDWCNMPGNGNDKKCTPSPTPPPSTTTPPPPPTTTAPPPPDPTPTPDDTPTPDPTPTPDDTPTPDPTPTPDDTPTPDPTPTPEATPTPTPTPEPTPTPSELPPDKEPPWPPPTEEPPPPTEEPPPATEEPPPPPPETTEPPPPPPETTEPPPPPPPETTEPPPPDDPGPTEVPPTEEPPDDGAVPPVTPDDPAEPPRTIDDGSGSDLRTPRDTGLPSTGFTREPFPDAGSGGSSGDAEAAPRQINEPGGLSWSLGRLLDSAGTAAKRLAFPLTLIIIVILFLLVQGELDRRDPKLAKAAINSELDLVMFQ